MHVTLSADGKLVAAAAVNGAARVWDAVTGELTFVQIIPELFDTALMRKEVAVRGGKVDLELPFRIESLPRFPVMQAWQNRYLSSGILVEVKNERKRAGRPPRG